MTCHWMLCGNFAKAAGLKRNCAFIYIGKLEEYDPGGKRAHAKAEKIMEKSG
jgi:hypothetical protein